MMIYCNIQTKQIILIVKMPLQNGVTVTDSHATAYTGDGSGLSGVSVGITTEALVKTNGQTASLDLTKDDHKVTATGTVTIDVTGGRGRFTYFKIVNSGIATVGFSTYFLFHQEVHQFTNNKWSDKYNFIYSS